MRLLSTLAKSLLENLRDYKILIFVLAFAPAFMFILSAMYGESETTYQVAVISEDHGQQGDGLIQRLQAEHYDSGKVKYQITTDINLKEGKMAIEKRQLDVILSVSRDFSKDIETLKAKPTQSPVPITLYGNTQNQRYAIAAIFLMTDFELFIKAQTGIQPSYTLREEFIGLGTKLTEFDMFVPGLLIFALLNVMFTAGASFLKEAEKLTLHRLMISKLRTWEFVFSNLIVQAILCVLAMSLALWAAIFNGFQFNGSYLLLCLICMISTLAVVGVALITVSFLKTVYDLMTIGIIPYFIVMFFSGLFFPLNSPVLGQVGGLLIKVNDLLPLTLSITAVNMVLNYDASLTRIMPELIGTTVVSLAYFTVGLLLFSRRHMRLKIFTS